MELVLGGSMQESIVGQGLDLLMTGMGSVMIFLAILVVLTNVMSSLISKYLPDPIVEPLAKRQFPSPSQPVDATTLSILQKAVDAHRSRKS